MSLFQDFVPKTRFFILASHSYMKGEPRINYYKGWLPAYLRFMWYSRTNPKGYNYDVYEE